MPIRRRSPFINQLLLSGVVALHVLALRSTAAQQPTSADRFAVQGLVFDSVANAPLAGAAVQVAMRGSASAPRTATTDSNGLYRVSGLPAGQYVIGFYHDALTVLGIDAPTTGIELATDTLVKVNLAIPSSRSIRTLRCGSDEIESSSGMLVGFVRDADQHAAVPGAVLRLNWLAYAFDAGNYRTVTERATATIDSDGSFLVCHVPIDAPLAVEVGAPGHRTVAAPLALIPANGIGRFDVALVDSALTRGTAVIRGRVTRASGKIVTTGRAAIAAIDREVAIQDGGFVIGDLPAGSWVVEARVIGVEPLSMMVDAVDGVPTPAQMTVGDRTQQLDAVTIVGKKDQNLQLLDEILRRKRIGMGTVFLPDSPALKSATVTSDVMREARGFLYQGQNKILGRPFAGGARCRWVAVYVDDVLQPDGFEGLNTNTLPSDILAIETWPDIVLAPVQYRIAKFVLGTRERYCAVVLAWTKNRPRG